MNRRKALQQAGILTGGAFAIPGLLSLFESCQSEVGISWEPLFFSEPEALLVSTLVDVILPRTDTPGALDVNADRFMDLFYSKALTEEEKNQLRAQIASFDSECKANFGASFVMLSTLEQNKVLERAEASSTKFNGSVWGTAVNRQQDVGFYRQTKSMAIWAYCSSEKIGKEILAYDPIPGEYIGCLPLSEIGKRWTF